MMADSDMRKRVAEIASHCPGCGWQPDGHHVRDGEDYTGDKHYHIRCSDCARWDFDHDSSQWSKRTPPGEDSPTVER